MIHVALDVIEVAAFTNDLVNDLRLFALQLLDAANDVYLGQISIAVDELLFYCLSSCHVSFDYFWQSRYRCCPFQIKVWVCIHPPRGSDIRLIVRTKVCVPCAALAYVADLHVAKNLWERVSSRLSVFRITGYPCKVRRISKRIDNEVVRVSIKQELAAHNVDTNPTSASVVGDLCNNTHDSAIRCKYFYIVTTPNNVFNTLIGSRQRLTVTRVLHEQTTCDFRNCGA